MDKCPIPIQLVRVKTAVPFTTFIDRDALSALKDHLAWREENHGPHDPDGPIFLTTWNRPVSVKWVSKIFFRFAKSAQVQRRLGKYSFKISAHEVRDLLKSTLMMCGCDEYAADHIIGHAPNNLYSKAPELYPEKTEARVRQGIPHAQHIFARRIEGQETRNSPEPWSRP